MEFPGIRNDRWLDFLALGVMNNVVVVALHRGTLTVGQAVSVGLDVADIRVNIEKYEELMQANVRQFINFPRDAITMTELQPRTGGPAGQ